MANGIQNRVRELRAVTFRGEVSQKELAERAGVDPSTVSDIENQKAQPSVETALALARVLGVSVEDLFLPSAIAAAAMDPASPTATAPSNGPVASEPPTERIAETDPAAFEAEGSR